MDNRRCQRFVENLWESEIVDELTEFIRIPNKSPHFDPDWEASGHMERAVNHMAAWCSRQPIQDMTLEIVRLPGRTPLLYLEIPGDSDDTVLLYGHLDKQPEMTGWDADLGPWTPVRRDDRLFGRGGADDGYAVYASLAAIMALRDQGQGHSRCVVLIEACEESGSYDLPAYVEALSARIGSPSLVVCLDSGCGNYEQLWCTTSLRGMAAGVLDVEILSEGVHSGDAGGVVPSSFRVLRQLISRLEDEQTGEIRPAWLHADIPAERVEQAAVAADVLGESLYRKFPFVGGGQPQTTEPRELVLNRTWRPSLEVTGADGLPPIADAGNVLRPRTRAKLALRLPPTVSGTESAQRLRALLEDNPPNGARVRFEGGQATSGWEAPPLAEWLSASLQEASHAHFGAPAVLMGEGGTIPFMAMLGERFPDAQFLITGVLGPNSNAHGPNEFLHIPMAKRLTCCIADIIAGHHAAGSRVGPAEA
ncbi:M20 family metallopeptidase [Ectothiorhodospiraceae bacterium WFHF3C12]|nr:M20 family metallopeptidase [Ectothiorhodospiraceae bacterium WFHF3C12]